MSEISKRLQRVREIAKSELKAIIGSEVCPVESILVSNSKYYGHRFKASNHTAQWLLEKDRLEILSNQTGETVKEVDLQGIATCPVVWPNAA